MGKKNKSILSKINLGNMGIVYALIVLIIIFSCTTKTFFTLRNLTNIARQISITGICAVGMTMVILTGGIDLSIGSLLGITSTVAALMLSNGLPIWLTCVVAIVLGAVIGVINAVIINELTVPQMIATLGTQISLRGVTYLITKGKPIYGLPEAFKVLGQGSIGSMPISSIIMLLVFVLGYIVINKRPFGRQIYGIGGNAETARLSGVNIKMTIMRVYLWCGTFGALAGLILTSRINSGQPVAGEGYEMDIVPSVVLGGISISGGEGKFIKVIIGVIFMGVLANGMMMLNINEYWQKVVRGIVLIIAVAVDNRSKEKARAVKA